MMCVRVQFLISIFIGLITINCSTGESSISSSVGVIDLRPKLSSDRIYLIDDNLCVGKAIFPSIKQGEDDSDPLYDDSTFDQQAATAYCIGSECSTVYLMISYDFANEKTVLHRAFGGTKLMSFVDGTRKSWETRRSRTKLIVLLLPSSTSAENQLKSFLSSIVTATDETETEMHDLTNIIKDNTMLKGAKVLLERLRSCFEYGGEKFHDVEIFKDAEFVCVDSNLENSDDNRVDDMILKHHPCHQTMSSSPKGEVFDHFKQLIISSYNSAAGSGDVNFI
mmetsp:Transcript_34910/g.71245  ORF Transcript_34910/g.71245 Transcript_34910/m.71245 type:complete len:280 (-) Transcript_34910:44-883(-)